MNKIIFLYEYFIILKYGLELVREVKRVSALYILVITLYQQPMKIKIKFLLKYFLFIFIKINKFTK